MGFWAATVDMWALILSVRAKSIRFNTPGVLTVCLVGSLLGGHAYMHAISWRTRLHACVLLQLATKTYYLRERSNSLIPIFRISCFAFFHYAFSHLAVDKEMIFPWCDFAFSRFASHRLTSAYTHARTHIHTHTHTHARARARASVRTHTHTHFFWR